jgi:polygalacturonase
MIEDTEAKNGYFISSYGAVAEGKMICTQAIQAAIDTAAAAGGGTVVVPSGTWRTGTLVLKSFVTLHLEPGSTLSGSTDLADYPEYIPSLRSYVDRQVSRSLIYSEDAEHIAITGSGTIDGNGGSFPQGYGDHIDKQRPYLIRIISCCDVRVENVHLRNSPMWMQHYMDCDRVQVRGISVYNHANYNNDGLDIDGCRDVTISDCQIDVDDDGLCLKSTFQRPAENITITNCIVRSHCTAIKFGTESNAGFRNITITNCTILSPNGTEAYFGYGEGRCGIALELVDGGCLENIVISTVIVDGVSIPLFMRLGNRARPYTNGLPPIGVGSFRNVVLSNIIATRAGKVGFAIAGLPGHCIENVTLRDLRIEFAGGGTAEDAARAIPECEAKYPEGDMFGILPAYGVYARHVRNLQMYNVQLLANTPDARPATVLDDVEEAKL